MTLNERECDIISAADFPAKFAWFREVVSFPICFRRHLEPDLGGPG